MGSWPRLFSTRTKMMQFNTSRRRQSCAGRQTSKHVRNLLEQAIDTDDAITPAAVIRAPLGIESDEVTNNSFPKNWPDNPEQRARVIGAWLRDEARFLVAYPDQNAT